jgi:hypothetical protein
MRHRRIPIRLVLAAAVLAAVAAGFAIAAVPDRQGRITACYKKAGGALRVLSSGTKCRRGETLLRWNQQGVAGVPGPAGAPGAAGANGAPGQPGAPGAPSTVPGPAGSDAGNLVTGSTMNLVAAVGETRYLHPSGGSEHWGMSTFAEMLSPNLATTARDLSVRLPGPPGAGESYTLTFQVDSVDTALGCTIAGDTDTTCVDSTDVVQIPAGSRMAFELQVSASAVSRRVMYGWRSGTP